MMRTTTRRHTPADLCGKKVTVVGLGRFGGGVGVTRWLCSQKAIVTVSDKEPESELRQSVSALKGLDVTLHLGGHLESDFLDADLLVVNPAVPKNSPLLIKAASAGVPCTTEINLFMERCKAPIVGITGSVGKSTTTAMTGAILSRRFTTHVGGNIGKSLLGELNSIRPDHVVVLELSSFQLDDLPIIGVSPHVALVTNVVRDHHVDRHGTNQAYVEAKKNIYAFQRRNDVLILNSDCRLLHSWATSVRRKPAGKVVFFDPHAKPFELKVPGMHNQANAQAAWTIARQFGIDRATAAEALAKFTGLSHRLEFVTEKKGVKFFNDSKCTMPEGGIVALKSFAPRQAVVIVGGQDKNENFSQFSSALARQAKAVVGIGASRDRILAEVESRRRSPVSPSTHRADTLAQAVAAAAALAQRGDVVLLCPACASYGMFKNYEDRGEQFCSLVKKT